MTGRLPLQEKIEPEPWTSRRGKLRWAWDPMKWMVDAAAKARITRSIPPFHYHTFAAKIDVIPSSQLQRRPPQPLKRLGCLVTDQTVVTTSEGSGLFVSSGIRKTNIPNALHLLTDPLTTSSLPPLPNHPMLLDPSLPSACCLCKTLCTPFDHVCGDDRSVEEIADSNRYLAMRSMERLVWKRLTKKKVSIQSPFKCIMFCRRAAKLSTATQLSSLSFSN